MIGLCWGAYSGDYQSSLYISIFFELFWLDVIPAGTFVPPHLTASTLAALVTATAFGLNNPPEVLIPIIVSMPLAWIGNKFESLLRIWQNKNYNNMLNWARNPEDRTIPSSMVLQSLLLSIVVSTFFFFCSILVIFLVTNILRDAAAPFFSSMHLKWFHIWIAATIGGLMAIRLRRVYLFLAFAVLAVGLAGILSLI